MKKPKFDKAQLQRLFIEHVEKLVFGVVVLGFLVFIYQAVGRPSYQKTPEQLRSASDGANQHIAQTDPKSVKAVIVDYPSLATRSSKRTTAETYEQVTRWNNPVFPSRQPRQEPAIYAVEELRGTSGAGAFTFKDGTNRLPGQRWAVITGLVPLAQQVSAHADAFRDHPRPDGDTPEYGGYRVERAEVTDPTAEPTALNWTLIEVRTALANIENWQGRGSEQAPPAVIHEKLTFPLGPINGEWDESVVHAPAIPLASSLATAGEEEKPAEKPAEASGKDRDFFGRVAPPKDEATGQRPRRRADQPPPPVERVRGEVSAAEKQESKYILFRFFDFDVEPGKQYRYRVQLGLKNPNFNVEARILARPELAQKEWLISDWSSVSNVISVPPDDQLLLLAVKAPRANQEPSAIVLALKWLAEKGTTVWEEQPNNRRGQLAFYPPSTKKPRAESDDTTESKKAGEKGIAPPCPGASEVTFASNMLLVDLRGGASQGGKDRTATEPAEALFLAPDGQFQVHSELDDMLTMEEKTKTKETSSEPGARGRRAAPPASGAGMNLIDLGGDRTKPKPKREPPRTRGKP